MIHIHGQIESLKRIREILDHHGITWFTSTGQINRFLKTFENEKESLLFNIERQYELELEILVTKVHHYQKEYESVKDHVENTLNNRISSLKAKSKTLSLPAKNAVIELLNWYRQQILLGYTFILDKGTKYIIKLKTKPYQKRLDPTQKELEAYIANRQNSISERFETKFKELEFTQKITEGLYPLIAGAIGEHKVAKELEKLPRPFVLINDFSLAFNKPIYNRRENDRIFSIQIDHLLVTPAGIFIIETKNWSKKSLERYDFRSPVKQVRRANFALYTLLNSPNTSNRVIKPHHWGQRKLPVKSIVAMIHHKPKERFKHVAIKTLQELNGHIKYFDPLFDNEEVESIGTFLINLKN
ncbi:nuclease-related domain-containing protein [Flagellimonas amoyensis]|uniref:nuclease-related domain-containing protein n=1 Tax=Flagellimonas amoyensis TaxID=2169401 RepID=UPI000D3A39F8|nr:nuclease-related domain-containing protein [Allomuricauda amoyensis]